MKRSQKKKFLKLFKTHTEVELADISENIGIFDVVDLKQSLGEWKLEPFFNIEDSKIIRNNIQRPCEKFIEGLKKTGKWVLKESIPIAISMATGGLGLGAVIAPVVTDIVLKLKNRGLNVSTNAQSEISNLISGKSDDGTLNNLIEKIKVNNTIHANVSSDLGNKIKLSLNEELFPLITEIKEVLNHPDVAKVKNIKEITPLQELFYNNNIYLRNLKKPCPQLYKILSKKYKDSYKLTLEKIEPYLQNSINFIIT